MSRVSERELVLTALRIMAASPDGFASTSNLIALLAEQFRPRGLDAQIATNRGDTYFSQKVRNLVCHRHEPAGIQSRGLADYDPKRKGWRITNAGRDPLERDALRAIRQDAAP